MSYCVFMHRSDSIYDDSPAERYQFPKQYLERARPCVGDWIVYLEPTKVLGTRGYFAIARVQDIIPDRKASGMYLALIEPGSYLAFNLPVPFNNAGRPIEHGLLNESGRLSGRAQAAVRPISVADFLRIVTRGLEEHEPLLPRQGDLDQSDRNGFNDGEQSPYAVEESRERVERLTSRIVRDRIFRSVVLRAYDERCAFTGLKLINGGGRAEVEAAHIRPVQANGPDVVNNGIALSGTMHWMFDRGLIGLGDDLSILVSRQVNDPDGVRAILNRTGSVLPPRDPRDRPHPRFLQWHRENCFKH
jgi:putative restriction endonuclease